MERQRETDENSAAQAAKESPDETQQDGLDLKDGLKRAERHKEDTNSATKREGRRNDDSNGKGRLKEVDDDRSRTQKKQNRGSEDSGASKNGKTRRTEGNRTKSGGAQEPTIEWMRKVFLKRSLASIIGSRRERREKSS